MTYQERERRLAALCCEYMNGTIDGETFHREKQPLLPNYQGMLLDLVRERQRQRSPFRRMYRSVRQAVQRVAQHIKRGT